jgi:hypothetical protein
MSELEQTIEELEAEVLAELEEGAHDEPMKNAAAAEPKKKMKGATPGGEVQDTGAPVVDPEQKDAPAKKTAAAAKEIGGDAQQKGEGKPDKMKKVKEGYTDEEIRELCHSKDHDCATVVEHPVWGLGKPITGSHAIPDDDGYVEWYDVQFKHGIEEMVMAEDMEILVNEAHKSEAMDMPKNKDEMLAAMKKMPMKDLEMVYANFMKKGDDDDEEDEDEDEMKEAVDSYVRQIDVSSDVNALMEGEELSEEFKEKAAAIFEAAVKSKTRVEIERIVEETEAEKQEEIEAFKQKISEDVDTYLDYVVEEWTKENELAIERGLKGEIAEDFISGLKQLFEDHYIDVPDERYDVLEAQSEKISELEEKLNEVIEKNIHMKEANSSLVREQVISEVSEDLADTEIEKFKSLVEDVDFGSEDMFREKLATLKENYFPKTQGQFDLDYEDGSTAQDIDTTDSMQRYLSAISRSKAGA